MEDFLNEFSLEKEQLRAVCKFFCKQVNKGLARSTHHESDVRCYVTCVQDLPNGQEIGKVLVLDLSNMNFRVVMVTLKGNSEMEFDSETYSLTKNLMEGRGSKLFDHIAKCLSVYIKGRYLEATQLPLVFTFSFPTMHKKVDEAILLKWTKGFKCSGVVNRDVVKLLREAIARQGGVKINVVAVLNDAIGTLLYGAYSNPNCRIAVIVDAGTNAVYMENTCKAEMLNFINRGNKYVAINLEWGAFGQDGCLNTIRTEYDRYIDSKSPNRGEQIFEKMISGMYLGELCRLTLLKATKLNLMFGKAPLEKILATLSKNNLIPTSYVLQIEADSLPDFNITRQILTEVFSLAHPCYDDIFKLRLICEAILKRSATLVAMGLAILVNRVNRDNVVVAAEGSVFRSNPKYATYVRKAMRKMVNPKLSYELVLSEDGRVIGGAILGSCQISENATTKLT